MMPGTGPSGQEEMIQLEIDLSALARATLYPATPDVAAAVRRRLAGASRALGPAPARLWQLAAVGLAAALILAAVLVGNAAPVRDVAADIWHRINVFETDQSTEGLPRDIEGTEINLADAEAKAGFAVKLPDDQALSTERVLLQEFGPTKVVVVFFDSPDGRFALFESPSATLGKGLPRSATSTHVSGLGDEAYWFEGERIVMYYSGSGNPIPQSVRATDVNTLAWAAGGRFYRIEGEITQEQAVRFAEAVP